MSKVLITTVPFGDKNRLPIEQLKAAGIKYLINPIGPQTQGRGVGRNGERF